MPSRPSWSFSSQDFSIFWLCTDRLAVMCLWPSRQYLPCLRWSEFPAIELLKSLLQVRADCFLLQLTCWEDIEEAREGKITGQWWICQLWHLSGCKGRLILLRGQSPYLQKVTMLSKHPKPPPILSLSFFEFKLSPWAGQQSLWWLRALS